MISLITATKDRVAELDRLLKSLATQTYSDFELLVVDQNQDDRLLPVLQRYGNLTVRHLRCSPGASRARNMGLRAARGEILGFPDDDCWYPEQLLTSISLWFQEHRDFGGLFAILRGPDNRRVGPKSPDHACNCRPATLFDCGATPNGFLRREVTQTIGYFDERIGQGAPTAYTSGEDADYFLRALEHGFRLRYDPQFTVHHPDWHQLGRVQQRAYGYALGGGFVMRVHPHLRLRFLKTVVRCCGGSVIRLCQGKPEWAQIYLWNTVGLLRGFFCGPAELRYLLKQHIADEPDP
jgi:glycosyltransferase involved in cell wall biosynthesis